MRNRRLLLLFFIFSLVLSSGLCGAETTADAPVLLKVEKDDGLVRTRLILSFTRLPAFEVSLSGQRVDLELAATEPSARLTPLAPDSTLIDTLYAKRNAGLMVSFLLRRPPIKVESEVIRAQEQVILTLLWGAPTTARPAIAYNIDGSYQVDDETGAIKRQPGSKYTGRWLQFFAEYQAPFLINAPMVFTLPPLVLPAELTVQSEGPRLAGAYAQRRWDDLQELLNEQRQNSGTPSPGLALLSAEVLARTGDFDSALSRLKPYLAKEKVAPYVRYLTAWLQASSGDHLQALLQLSELKLALPDRSPYRDKVALLEAEIALANGSVARALRTLERVKDWSEPLKEAQRLRLLDGRALRAKLVGSAEAYAPWLQGDLIYQHPFSLGLAAVGLYRQGDYAQAKQVLSLLSRQVDGPETQAMILYAQALIDAQLDPSGSIDAQLNQLQQLAPDSEAALRAQLLLTDRRVFKAGGSEPMGALATYRSIATQSLSRPVRQEAMFKRGVLLYVNKKLPAAIEALTAFRRGYQQGALRSEAAALLAEALPQRISQLIDNGEDMKALVLVEKNRELLLESQLNTAFLRDLALSMNRLGLWDRAARVYLYMLDASAGRPEFQQNLYLPLITLFYKNGEYTQADNYCARYFKTYNEGDDRYRIYELWIRSRRAAGDQQGMLYLLGRPDRPSDSALEALACEIYWSLKDYQAVQRTALRVKNLSEGARARIHFLQAESLYRLGRLRQANTLYQQLTPAKKYRHVALYRRATVHRTWGQDEQARQLLKRLKAQKEQSGWKTLAQDLLIEMGTSD